MIDYENNIDEVYLKKMQIIKEALEPINNAISIMEEEILELYNKLNLYIVSANMCHYSQKLTTSFQFMEELYKRSVNKKRLLLKILDMGVISVFELKGLVFLPTDVIEDIYNEYLGNPTSSKILLFESRS